jgi:hypothetical protein
MVENPAQLTPSQMHRILPHQCDTPFCPIFLFENEDAILMMESCRMKKKNEKLVKHDANETVDPYEVWQVIP